MPRVALSSEIIATLPPPEKGKNSGWNKGGRIMYWDESLARFGVEVHSSGKRVFKVLVGPDKFEQIVNLGNANFVAYGFAKAQAMRILEEYKQRITKEDETYDTTAGRFWIAEQPSAMFPWAVFWAHPIQGQWHQKIAAFRDRGRAENYILAESQSLLPDFIAADLKDKPPAEEAPVSRIILPRDPDDKEAPSYVTAHRSGYRYQRPIPSVLQPFLGGRKMISRHISSRIGAGEVRALVKVYTSEDDELFKRLREEHGLNSKPGPPKVTYNPLPGVENRDRNQKIIDAIKAGASQEEIVSLFGTSQRRVRALASRSGVPLAKPIKIKETKAPSPKITEACDRIMAQLNSIYQLHPTGMRTAHVADYLGLRYQDVAAALKLLSDQGNVQWVYTHACDSKYLFPIDADVPKHALSPNDRRVLTAVAKITQARGLPAIINRTEVGAMAEIFHHSVYAYLRKIAKKGYITIDETYTGLDGLRITSVDAPEPEASTKIVLNMRRA